MSVSQVDTMQRRGGQPKVSLDVELLCHQVEKTGTTITSRMLRFISCANLQGVTVRANI